MIRAELGNLGRRNETECRKPRRALRGRVKLKLDVFRRKSRRGRKDRRGNPQHLNESSRSCNELAMQKSILLEIFLSA